MNIKCLDNLTHGMYIIGSVDGKRPVGSTVDAIMQVSITPMALALSCLNSSYTKKCIEKCGEFSVSILGKNVDPFVIANFGFQSSENIDKWDNVKYHIYKDLPVLTNCLSALKCKVIQKIYFDSHTLFISEITESELMLDGEALTYLDYKTSFKNDVLKFVPEILKTKEKIMAENEKKWVCTVCGWEYDGETPFEDLPDDFQCPLCGVGKEMFEQR